MRSCGRPVEIYGALVQLVRMPACHAGGHEFESRTHRRKQSQFEVAFFVLQLCFSLFYFLVLWKFSGGAAITLKEYQ